MVRRAAQMAQLKRVGGCVVPMHQPRAVFENLAVIIMLHNALDLAVYTGKWQASAL